MPHINRREAILGAGSLLTAAAAPAQAQPRQSDLVRRENQHEGTTDWQLTYTRVDPKTRWRSPRIEGYLSKQSVRAGDTLDFFVSTNPAAAFVIDIYRLGYYQGRGGRHLRRLGPFDGKVQPTPPVGEQRLRECRWEACTRLTIAKDWPSGVYLGKLSQVPSERRGDGLPAPPGRGVGGEGNRNRYQSYVVFIVRDDRPADFLFQCSDNTWQAYNQWPDSYSLYTNDRFLASTTRQELW